MFKRLSIPHWLRLKQVDQFILRSYMGPMILTFFIALFILLMQFLWKYVDDMVGKGFEWYVIAELLFYASATFVPMALPLAVLLASLMTFGNLGEHYELVALKASGISFRRAMAPLVICSIFLSAFAFYFSNNVLPVANLKFGALLFDVREKKPALNINEGVFYNEIEGYVIRIGKKGKDGKTIENVMIYDHTDDAGNTNVTLAERGEMINTQDKRYLIFRLFNGYNYSEDVKDRSKIKRRPFQRTKFQEEMRRFDLSAFQMSRTNAELFKDHCQMMNLDQLTSAIDTLHMDYLKREDQFKDFLLRSFFFHYNIDSANYVSTDTAAVLQPDFLSNFESGEDKLRLLDIALSSSRGVKQHVEISQDDYRIRKEVIAKHEIEWQRKFTLSIACLILFFVGAPLGAIIRKGGLGMPVVFATLFFIIYHVISITGEKATREGVIPAWEGMWIAAVIFLPVGILLTYSASTDARIMSRDFWILIFRFLGRIITAPFRRKKQKQPTA